MEVNNVSSQIKELSQDVRINSAFNCLYEQFEKGQYSKAFNLFSNTVKKEIEFAQEKETIILDNLEASPE